LQPLLPSARMRGEGLGEVGGSVTKALLTQTLSSTGGEGFALLLPSARVRGGGAGGGGGSAAKALLTQPSPPQEERALKPWLLPEGGEGFEAVTLPEGAEGFALLLPSARLRGEGLGEVGVPPQNRYFTLRSSQIRQIRPLC